jgi:hypothetical protein
MTRLSIFAAGFYPKQAGKKTAGQSYQCPYKLWKYTFIYQNDLCDLSNTLKPVDKFPALSERGEV